MELWSRRKFFLTSLAGSAVAGANKLFGRDTVTDQTRPLRCRRKPKMSLKASAR